MATSIPWSELRREIDLAEVENALGIEVVEIGEEHVASCPLPSHAGEDEHPSFSINSRTYAFNCFSCGIGGPLFRLVEEMLSLDYDAAIEWLRPFAGEYVEGDTKWLARIEKRLNTTVERPKMVREPLLPYFELGKLSRWQSLRGNTDYFDKRGLDIETQQAFKLGYDPAYPGHKWTAPAIVIPHIFRGDLVGWQARNLADLKPKYDSSTDFPKKDTLFNWDMVHMVPDTTPVLVVESPLSVMRLYQHGFLAIATFGASISDRQVQLLSTRTSPLWLAYDNDGAGQEAVKRLAGLLSVHRPVEIVPAPEGEKADLGDCTRAEVESLVAQRNPAFLAYK